MKVEEDTAVAVGSVDDVKAGDGKEVDNNEVDDGEDADIELDDGNNGTEVCVDVSVDAVVVENDDDDDVETEGNMLTLKQVRMIVLAHLAYIQYLSIFLSTNIR